MAQSPKFPLVWDTWSTCSTCGQWVPSRFVTLSRKWGFQCLPGNGQTPGCFDGNYDRDDIYFLYPGAEGTRETYGPLTNYATQGVTAGDSYTIYTLYDRADPDTAYDVTFSTGLNGTISFPAASLGNPTVGGIELNNGWTLYIQSGFMQFSQGIEIVDSVTWNGDGDLAVIGGFLQYTPYVQQNV